MAIDLFNIQRGIMRSLAAAHKLNGDSEEFNCYYELFQKAHDYDKKNRDTANAAVKQRVEAIKIICDEVPKGEAPLSTTVEPRTMKNPIPGLPDIPMLGVVGLGVVKRVPSSASYVIFSDHHMTARSSRQDFFARHNKRLYLDILQDYYAVAGFDLVENGDVEELLIFEPDLSEMDDIGKWDWDRILSYRGRKAKETMREIARNNADYYDVLHRDFASKKKYHKIVGNHDVALMNDDMIQLLRDETGHWFERPAETVLISDDESHRYFICHGHQFDHSCTAGFAERIGESYSQAGAWAYQGPDRQWMFTKDWLDEMLEGKRPVLNHVVSTEPTGMTAGDIAALVAAFATGVVIAGSGAAGIAATLASGTLTTAAMQAVFNIVPPQRFFEEVMQKNIAWEYFEDTDDTVKLFRQIADGVRWFKVRHTEEIALTDFLANEVPAFDGVSVKQRPWGNRTPPTVVIGHSHEPRLRARRTNGKTARHYINSAAAGRFANLIWGVEIVDGKASMISWHRGDADAPIRTIWEPFSLGPASVLRPTSQATLAELAATLPKDKNEAPPIDDTNTRIAVAHVL